MFTAHVIPKVIAHLVTILRLFRALQFSGDHETFVVTAGGHGIPQLLARVAVVY